MPLNAVLEVLNQLGIHARPAVEFVRCAQKFASTSIRLHKDDETFCATSILEVLSASLDCGSHFTLEADGPEAAEAIEALSSLMVHFRDQEQEGDLPSPSSLQAPAPPFRGLS